MLGVNMSGNALKVLWFLACDFIDLQEKISIWLYELFFVLYLKKKTTLINLKRKRVLRFLGNCKTKT